MNDPFEIEMVKDTNLQAGRLLLVLIPDSDTGGHSNSNCTSNNAADDMP